MSKTTTILAIETSCDETGVAVLRHVAHERHGTHAQSVISVLAEGLASQMDIHAKTGGVVPEVAAREHVSVIRPLIEDVLERSGVQGEELDVVAVTIGPGLMPALSVGVQAARTLAYAWGKPLVPVHHIEGHVYSALLQSAEGNSKSETRNSKQLRITNYELPITSVFPSLALIVSGGHTMLIRIEGHLQYKVIGTTRDDAVGEVFDKVARMLELPYPGGPHVSKLAEQGDPVAFDFPRPMLTSGNLDFSYSGLKTAVLYALRDVPENEREQRKADLAASFQEAVVDSLAKKVRIAVEQEEYKTLLLAGGVAANKLLRERMAKLAEEVGIELRIAPLALCGDNAVMIGQVGLLALEAGRTKNWRDIDAIARVSIEEFSV